MKKAAALLLLAATASAHTTWYVDSSGTPPGSGSLADPYTSIQYAIDQPTTLSGDTLLAAPGTYLENVQVGSKWIDVIGTGGADACVIQAAGPGPVVVAGNVRTLRGFTITGGSGDGVDCTSFDGRIESCLITANAGRGLALTGDGGYVTNCTVVGCGLGGLYMQLGSGVNMSNTIIWGNGAPSSYSIAAHSQGSFRYNLLENFTYKNKCNLFYELCGNLIGWDPLFVDPALGNYHLQLGSPCVDAGDPLGPLDPDGTPFDIGVFAFDPASSPGPVTYCTSKVNSQGCTPAIGFSGTPSASGAPFDVTCSDVINNKVGLLFYGFQAKALPYQEGTLCVTAPVRRTPLQNAGGNPPPDDCSGLYTYDFDARIQSGADPMLASGALVYAQYWYRDPQHPGAFTTGRSDALAFMILP
jgi:hypothetical protein